MRPKDKLALRASEIRKRLAEIGGTEDLTDEIKSELAALRTEYADIETRIQAFTVAGDEPTETRRTEDTEDRELRQLIDGADLADIFDAAVEHRNTVDQTAELQQHLSLSPNQVPLALLFDAPLERRDVTPAPANVGQQQAEIIPGVFPTSCAAFLGVDMPTVDIGEKVYPVLATNATVHSPAENAEAAETTGSFTADVLSPKRLQASFIYSREDRARFRGMASALRQNLSDALANELDKKVLVGSNGLLTGTNLANQNANAQTTYANYRAQLAYGRVDGRYAMTVKDLRIVMGDKTYAHASAQFRSDNAGDRAALEDLEAVTNGVMVSTHVPVPASNKQNVVIRLGMRRDMVAPIWEGVTLIPDEVTKAKSGQIVITAAMMHAVKILRADGFYKQQVQLA